MAGMAKGGRSRVRKALLQIDNRTHEIEIREDESATEAASRYLISIGYSEGFAWEPNRAWNAGGGYFLRRGDTIYSNPGSGFPGVVWLNVSRDPGRPQEEEEPMENRLITINRTRWDFAKAQEGGASAFFRRCIDEKMREGARDQVG